MTNLYFDEDFLNEADEASIAITIHSPKPFARLTNGQIHHRGQTYSSLPYEVYVSYQNKKSATTTELKQIYNKQFSDALKTYMPEHYMDFFGCTICGTELPHFLCDDAQVCVVCKNK
jgi:hypothetical protein